MCLDKYTEKFFKTDAYLNSLFDEIAQFLGKLVNCVNDLARIDKKQQLGDGRSHLNSSSELKDDESAAVVMNEALSHHYLHSSQNRSHDEVYELTKANKKYLQDNLNNLNRTVALARKSMIELVITSTMIGSLKQVQESNQEIEI